MAVFLAHQPASGSAEVCRLPRPSGLPASWRSRGKGFQALLIIPSPPALGQGVVVCWGKRERGRQGAGGRPFRFATRLPRTPGPRPVSGIASPHHARMLESAEPKDYPLVVLFFCDCGRDPSQAQQIMPHGIQPPICQRRRLRTSPTAVQGSRHC